MLTHTIDEYVASLYDHLLDSLAIARDCAIRGPKAKTVVRP